MVRGVAVIVCALACLGTGDSRAVVAGDGPSPEEKALAWLAGEVPQWPVENKCFSCHNNGDAARALYTAVRLGHHFDEKTLADTTDWLSRPRDWKDNGGDEAFSDKKLATLQFAAALAAAERAGVIEQPESQNAAAEMVAGLQQPDGSWRIEGPDTIGSPVTWGRSLATALARDVLRQTDARRFASQIGRADRWLRSAKTETVLDAAAVLVGLGAAQDEAAANQRTRCLDFLRSAEAPGGGWGPYANARPEPFDTAVVLIALRRLPAEAKIQALIDRGREYLIAGQLADGSWPETTRPANATSYAHRVSTTAWAAEALLLTSPR